MLRKSKNRATLGRGSASLSAKGFQMSTRGKLTQKLRLAKSWLKNSRLARGRARGAASAQYPLAT